MLPVGPMGHQIRVGDQHARRVLVGLEHADRLARLDQQGLVALQLGKHADQGVVAGPVARGPADAAVDHQLLRLLGDLGVQVVHQHAERRLGQPGPGGELRAARRADLARVVEAGILSHGSAPLADVHKVIGFNGGSPPRRRGTEKRKTRVRHEVTKTRRRARRLIPWGFRIRETALGFLGVLLGLVVGPVGSRSLGLRGAAGATVRANLCASVVKSSLFSDGRAGHTRVAVPARRLRVIAVFPCLLRRRDSPAGRRDCSGCPDS
jgi:hypothetical protein